MAPPYETVDADVMVRDVAVRDARQAGARLAGSFADLNAGGDPAGGLVNGYFADDGTWVERPAKGVLFFGPPGLG